MQCSSCGAILPPTAAFCQECGAETSYAIPSSEVPPYGSSVYDPSLQQSPPSGTPPYVTPAYDPSLPQSPPPSTDYGAPPYGLSQPYSAYNPYEVVAPPPPPPPLPMRPSPPLPPAPRRNSRLGLIIGTVVLVLVLASFGVFALFSKLASHGQTIAVSSPTATSVQSTPTAAPTPTIAATAGTATAGNTSYGSYSGTLVINDPLHDNSQGYNWQNGSDSNGSCTFTAGEYQVKSQNGGYFYDCNAQKTDYANFVFEVQMKIVQGDCAGVLFRVNNTANDFYFLDMCHDGTIALYMYTNNNGSTLITSHTSSAIHTGYNQSNLVAIAAQGSTLTMYINHQQTDSVSDSSYSHGSISLVVDGYPTNHPTTAVYSNAKLWQL